MAKLHIDIETRSAADLRKTGQYVYAEHPTTEITHVAWALGDAPVQVWLPPRSNWNPAPVVRMVDARLTYAKIPPPPKARQTLYKFYIGGTMPAGLATALGNERGAHNASFERNLLSAAPGQRLGFPAGMQDPTQWDCTAARAARFGLPRTLEGAAAALGLDIQKDKDGHKLMLRMCKPRKPRKTEIEAYAFLGEQPPLFWVDDEESMLREGIYCAIDVETEQALDAVLPSLSPFEREVWETTERMNDGGMPVDLHLLQAMLRLIEEATSRINAEMSERTGGAVPKVSDHMALTWWLLARGVDDADGGVSKAAVAAMLENPAIDGFTKEVLILRRDGGGSAISKYAAILQRVSRDGFIRGVLVYCGAAATGRWSSRGAQLHNLPRGGAIKGLDINAVIRDLLAGASDAEIALMYGAPLVVATECLRPLFGYREAANDAAPIEAGFAA